MMYSDFMHRFLQALSDIHSSFSLQQTQAATVRNAALLFGARGASLMLYNPSEETLIVGETFGLSDAYRSKGTVSPRQSLGETIGRKPVVVRDISTDPNVQYREEGLREGIRSIVGLPLAAGSALVGALRLYYAQPKEFAPEEMAALEALAHQAGLALKKSFYFASMKDAVSEIQAMPSMDFKEALHSLIQIVARYGLAKGSALFLIDRKTNSLSGIARYGLSQRYLDKGPVFMGVSLGEVTTGKTVVISDAAKDPRVQYKEAAAQEHIHAILGLPLVIGKDVAGALRLYYSFTFDPDADYIMWMEHLAHQVGMALEKTQLLIKVKERADWYEEVLKEFER
jgi:GAF domain-containing protein